MHRSSSHSYVLFRLFLATLLVTSASAQTLARPGWVGSGMSLEPWWTHAIFYQVDPHGFRDSDGNGTGDLRGLTSQLDYIHSLGVDAITLTRFQPTQGELVPRSETVDPAVGSLDDFDELVREASRDSLRLVVELDPQQLADPAALATVSRFWLGRGAAGISLRTSAKAADAQQQAAQLRRVHEVTRSFAGQRILIAEGSRDAEATRYPDADLILNSALATVSAPKAADLRAAMEHLQAASAASPLIAVTDSPDTIRSATRLGDQTNGAAAAKVIATLLLATRANAQLFYGQEIGLATGSDSLMPWGTPIDPDAKKPKVLTSHGPEVAAEEADPDSLLTWYRRLIDLHHGNSILRSGASDFLNHDDQNSIVWVSRKGAVTPLAPAIVVACNLSAKPVTLSLTGDLQKLHLRGNFLRTVLRSDNGMGGLSLDAVTLPPFGIYIGEVRF